MASVQVVAENLCSVIAPKAPSTVRDFIARVKQHEELFDRRNLKNFIQGFSGNPLATPIDTNMAAYTREVVREEVRLFQSVRRSNSFSTDKDDGRLPAMCASTFLSVSGGVQDKLRALDHPVQPAPSAALCPIQHDLNKQSLFPAYRSSHFHVYSYSNRQRRRTDI